MVGACQPVAGNSPHCAQRGSEWRRTPLEPLHKQAQRDVNRKALRAQQPFHPCNLSWDHDEDRDGSIHSWGAAVNPKPQPQGDCCHSRASSSCGCATVSLRALWMTWHQHIQPAGTGLASEGCSCMQVALLQGKDSSWQPGAGSCANRAPSFPTL